LLLAVVLFIVGLVLLIKGGDWFVDGAVGIAKKLHIPDLLIGATVVSLGTTLPEVMVSAGAAVKGQGAMAYGNALGSIICNTALISAITIAVMPSIVDRKTIKTPIVFYFSAAIIYAATAYVFGFFYRWVGIALLVVFAIYMTVLIIKTKKEIASGTGNPPEETTEKERSILMNVFLLILGAALIAVGADLLVDNGTIIARTLGVPETVIALTFVALGTSLPELVTAITSLAKGHGALSLGNIIGANLFNLVLVSGIAITLNPFKVPADKLIGAYNASLVLDIPLTFIVMGLLTLPALITGKLKRWQGITLLVIYFSYCIFQFVG
jgi:cation:H+ antiporter